MIRIKKTIRKRKQKRKHHREVSLRLNDLNTSKTELENKIDALRQIISHIQEVKYEVKLKIKQVKKKIKNLPIENPFDFAQYVENQNEENELDL